MSNGTTKPIRLSHHARGYLSRRGFTETEVVEAIRQGHWRPTHQGRWEPSREFAYNGDWNGTYYASKRVRRLDLCGGEETTPGLHRIAWDLRPDTPNAPSRCASGRGGAGFGGGFGRGGGAQQVALGRYTATIGTLGGDTFTAIGAPASFLVIALPR